MTQLLNQLTAGQKFAGNLLLRDAIALKKHDQTPYAQFILSDASSKIVGLDWNMDTATTNEFKALSGQVVTLVGTTRAFNDQIQLNISDIKPLDPNDPAADPAQYIEHAPLSTAELKQQIGAYISHISQFAPGYAQIVNYIMTNRAKTFYIMPAAESIHHAFYGGLAYHTLRMLNHAKRLYEDTTEGPLYRHVDPILLETAIILHDCGKTLELASPLTATYTIPGRLLGHISIADGWIVEAAIMSQVDPQSEPLLRLRHAILAHHGQLEWGSPVTPATPEAQALHFIDNMDARSMIFEHEFDAQEAGTLGARNFGLGKAQPYKAETDQDQGPQG